MYFTIYSVLFLEDKQNIQELCTNLQSTMAVESWNMYIIFCVVWASGTYSKNLQPEETKETMAFRNGNQVPENFPGVPGNQVIEGRAVGNKVGAVAKHVATNKGNFFFTH